MALAGVSDAFDAAQALTLVRLCQAAYELSLTGTCVLPDGFSPAVPLIMRRGTAPAVLRGDDRSVWGLTTVRGGVQHAAFRGTESFPEWLADICAFPLRLWAEDARAHRGFNDIFDALWSNIAGEVAADAVFTGHSLGAPLAAMAWLRSGARGQLTRFASPRPGDAGFAALLKGTWRVANKPDLVPHLPSVPGFSDGGELVTLLGPGAWEPEVAHSLASYATALAVLIPGPRARRGREARARRVVELG